MSQLSTGLSDDEKGSNPGSRSADFPLDFVHPWSSWCSMVGISTTTGWRLIKNGKGPVVTQLTAKLKGVRHRHHLAWLTAREQQNGEAA